MRQCLAKAWRLHRQQPKGKNKLYAWHAPEAECIAKGKARRPYEFGVKASIAVTARSGLIVGARTFPGNPYDGHCLAAQIEQSTILLQDIAENPIQTVIADLGYRGVDHEIAPVQLVHRGKRKRLGEKAKRWLRRRQAIEPVIGHLKADHRMDRCWLKGAEGDAIHTVLCAAGFNLGWLLRAIAERLRRGRFFVANFWLLIQALSRALLAGYRRLRSQLVLHPPPAGT